MNTLRSLITLAATSCATLASPSTQDAAPFTQERKTHETQLLVSEHFPPEPLPPISHPSLEQTTYTGPLGEYAAIATRPTDPETKKPAVVWITGGFGGIFEGFDTYADIDNDQSVASFLDRDIVMFLPSFRGEHENPGVFECFYGEVDDLVAAIEHVAQRPDVDPDRIFVMGHSTGGTNALLSALMTDIPAGVVSFGGAPDMASVVADGKGYESEPYDIQNEEEVRLRSAIEFTADLKAPVLYIEGQESFYVEDAYRMQRLAKNAQTDFNAAIIPGENHFSVLRPGKDYLAQHIESGNTELPSPEQIRDAIKDYYDNPNTRLLLNARTGTVRSIQQLLNQGADANVADPYGTPAIAMAASDNTDPGVVLALANAGADVNTPDSDGITPLMYAVSNWSTPEPAKQLIDANADVNAKDNEDDSVLHFAAMSTTNPEVIQLLIQHNADINARNQREQTALMIAAEYNTHADTISALINAGLNPDTQTSYGATALMFACVYTTNPDIIDTLLDAGADASLKDKDGDSALDLALRNESLQGSSALQRLREPSE